MDRKPAPDRAALHEAALLHLSRYAVTEAGLRRVLERRVARWARDAGAAPEEAAPALAAAREVARALAETGIVDDAAFAAARARRLQRSGRSRRAAAASLVAKGVDPALAARALDGEPIPGLAAALAFARTRRIGPFRRAPAPDGAPQRDLGALARAGFPRSVAEQALATAPDEAEAIVHALKRG